MFSMEWFSCHGGFITNFSLMDGHQWIVRIRNSVNAEFEEDGDISPTIASVPKPLIVLKPEAYIPQLIALGPYHHSREELHQMERLKLFAARRMRIQLPDVRFEHIVDMFCKIEYRIRAHYQRYLALDGECLAWMMAIDASFLLEFLQTLSLTAQNVLRIPSKTKLSVNTIRRTSTHDMLVRDIIMLENQVPLFLLLKVLEIQAETSELAKETLLTMVMAFLKDLTPFKKATNFQCIETETCSHLLDLLYHSVTPSYDEEPLEPMEAAYCTDCPQKWRGFLKDSAVRAKVFFLARTKALISLVFKFLIKIPWSIISSIPVFAVLKTPVENILNPQMDTNTHLDCTEAVDQCISASEITIPSVTELSSVGIQFEPTLGDMSSIAFDAKAAALHLPQINLDVNSEVVLRNLVAYEAAIVSGPLAFTRYVELMNGIIDTEEDAKMLREKGVIVNQLRSDKEVAELWNGMSRSVRLTKVRILDEVIEEVNKYYNARWKVKLGRFVRRYIKGSWQVLVVLILILLLLVVGIHAFSTVFGFLRGSWAYKRGGRR